MTDVCAFLKSQFYTTNLFIYFIHVSDYIVSFKLRKQNFSIFVFLFQDYLDYNYVFCFSIILTILCRLNFHRKQLRFGWHCSKSLDRFKNFHIAVTLRP